MRSSMPTLVSVSVLILTIVAIDPTSAMPAAMCAEAEDAVTCHQFQHCFWLATSAVDAACFNVEDTVPLEQASCAMLSRSSVNCLRARQSDNIACPRCRFNGTYCTEEWDAAVVTTSCLKHKTPADCEKDLNCSWHGKPDQTGSSSAVPSPHCVAPPSGDGLGVRGTGAIECCGVQLRCSYYTTACRCRRISPGCVWSQVLGCVEEDGEDDQDEDDDHGQSYQE